MRQRFDKNRALNAVLYIIDALGGQTDMHKIFKILYFSDRDHLSKYGRTISSDTYIAMRFGPVPSKTDDIFKAVRGDSFFSDRAGELNDYFTFVNKFIIKALKRPDIDYLSESDVECLKNNVETYRNYSFDQLTNASHGIAWNASVRDREMLFEDILREAGDTEEYVDYIAQKLKLENAI